MSGSCVIIYSNFGPYHIVRLRALAEILPETLAIEVASDQKIYPWRPNKHNPGFQSKTLFTGRSFESIPIRQQSKAIKETLSEIIPEIVVVAGYREPVMRAAAKWAIDSGAKTVLLFVSTWFDHRRKWWKEFVKKRIVARYSAIAATGRRSEEYLRKLGVPCNRIFETGNVIDNTYFEKNSETILDNKNYQRSRLNLPEHYFLVVSRLSPEKNYPRLLESFQNYREKGGKWNLVIAGGGPQERELLEMIKAHGISGVSFAGWQSYETLPAYYALASCFILPSLSEPWGLVVNEAMACGLPILVSRQCGCSPELCQRGLNSYDFDPRDTKEITSLMLRASSGQMDLGAMGKASRQIVSDYTPETWARKLKNCIDTTLKQRR